MEDRAAAHANDQADWGPAKSLEDTEFDEEVARASMADAVRLLEEVLA
jgi:hypothetical protein